MDASARATHMFRNPFHPSSPFLCASPFPRSPHPPSTPFPSPHTSVPTCANVARLTLNPEATSSPDRRYPYRGAAVASYRRYMLYVNSYSRKIRKQRIMLMVVKIKQFRLLDPVIAVRSYNFFLSNYPDQNMLVSKSSES